VLAIPPKKMMVVGYDTHHDGARKGASVGGFVCSLNQSLSRYFSRVSYHNNQEELSNNFAANFIEGLKAYLKHNEYLPERIIVYRDGVSDGQIQHVHETEMPQIQKALEQVANGSEQIKYLCHRHQAHQYTCI